MVISDLGPTSRANRVFFFFFLEVLFLVFPFLLEKRGYLFSSGDWLDGFEAAALDGEGDDGVGRMDASGRPFFFSYKCLRGMFAGE